MVGGGHFLQPRVGLSVSGQGVAAEPYNLPGVLHAPTSPTRPVSPLRLRQHLIGRLRVWDGKVITTTVQFKGCFSSAGEVKRNNNSNNAIRAPQSERRVHNVPFAFLRKYFFETARVKGRHLHINGKESV